MSSVVIKPDVYWVGAVDWNIRTFHGPAYSTPRGTTYNAYLIVDEQITLVDTVYGPFAQELIRHIAEIVDPAKIDNIIINHIESDHIGAFPEIMRLAPNANVYATANAVRGIKSCFSGIMILRLSKLEIRSAPVNTRSALSKLRCFTGPTACLHTFLS